MENNLMLRKNQAGALNVLFSGYSVNTLSGYKSDLKLFEDFIKKTALNANAGDIINYFNYLKENFKNNTVNRKMISLSSLYEKMTALKMMPANPVKQLKQLRQVKTQAVNHSINVNLEIEDIKQALNHVKDDRLKLIIKTLATTGLRVSELINIKRADIKTNHLDVSVLINGKGNKERVILLPVKLYQDILKTFPENDYLFTTRGGKAYNRINLYTQIQRAFKSKNVHPHLFRHFYATDRIKNTNDIKAVSEYLGHSTTQITLDFYTHSKLTAVNAFINLD